MNIVILNGDDKPIYEQIYNQLAAQIIGGELTADFCLPSIRNVARELSVSIITVKKAYELLEAGGFIYTKAGKGCFVAPMTKPCLEDKKRSIVEEKLKKDIPYYRELGLSLNELIGLISEFYKDQK